LLIAGLITVCFGAILIRRFLHERQLGEQSLSWPQTEGVVTWCEYHASGRHHSSYTEISYRYSVDGIVHYSDQATVANHEIRGNAKEFAVEHPNGTTIPVYYDRNHPGTAVLRPGIDPENTRLLYLFGGLLGLLGVSCLAYLYSFRNLIFGRTDHSHA
jgi:hypothetical protein